jgi:membrane-bound hydrogenase subunit beta
MDVNTERDFLEPLKLVFVSSYPAHHEADWRRNLMREETIKQDLETRFPVLIEKIAIQRARRVWIEVPFEQFHPVLDHCVDALGINILLTITGLDQVETYGVIYHMATLDGVIVNLKIQLSKANPVIRSVTPRFPSADAYERELRDLLGIEVTGLPEGPRYPLPDNWPEGQYPLRKDWKSDTTPPAEEGATHA